MNGTFKRNKIINELRKIKDKIGVKEFEEICKQAIIVEESLKTIEKSIRLGFVYPLDVEDTLTNAETLIYMIWRIVKKVDEDKANKLKENLINLLKFIEADKDKELRNELIRGTPGYPSLSLLISKIDSLINIYVLRVLKNTMKIREKEIYKEFITDILRLAGLTVKPEEIRAFEKRISGGEE